MKLLTRSPRRGLAAGLAGALVAGAFAGLAAAPAQAAPATGDLTWTVSAQVESGFGAKSASGGATLDANTFTFPAESVVTATDGTVTTAFDGSATAGALATRGGYSVTFTNPVITLKSDGTGSLKATVNSFVPGATPESTTPTLVTVANIASSTTVGGVVSATPSWAGVLEPGSQLASDLGVASGRPFAGKSFHPEFLGAIDPGVRSWFYQNTDADDVTNRRAPATLTFSAESATAPTVTTTVVSESKTDGVQVKVDGQDFTPGAVGVYAILAPANTVIDFSDQDEAAKYETQWVTPAQFTDGAFTTVISANPDKLQVGKQYAVYTIAAHGSTDRSQDTETLVNIDWTKFEDPKPAVKRASKATLKINKKANRKKAGKATVTVKGTPKATGKVKVTIKIAGVKKAKKLTIKLNKKGKASFNLPKAKKKAQYKITVKYTGDKNYKASKKVVKKYKVKR